MVQTRTLYFLKDFIYLLERMHELGGGAEGDQEADSPLSGEPDVGLQPRTLGS